MYTRNYNFCRTQAVDNGCSDERDLHSLTKLGDSKSLTQDADVKEIHDFLSSHHNHRWDGRIRDAVKKIADFQIYAQIGLGGSGKN